METNYVDAYYIQDGRSMVGNSMLWWAQDGAGYTCDVAKAHVFTLEEALSVVRGSFEKPWTIWPAQYIDSIVTKHADHQRVNLEFAHVDEQVLKSRSEWLKQHREQMEMAEQS